MSTTTTNGKNTDMNDHKRQKTATSTILSSNNNNKSYRDYLFYRYEQVEEKWLSVERPLEAETLCWVTHSRGKKRKNAKKLNQRAHVVTGEYVTNIPSKSKNGSSDSGDNGDVCRGEEEQEPRIQIRYPKGSMYHVRRSNLIPVLAGKEQEKLVIVLPETNYYRRWSTVHTRPYDYFVEIGCDFGMLVQKVWEFSSCPQYVTGLDKAPEDITEAQKRYPGCNFRLWDVPLGLTSAGGGGGGGGQTTTSNDSDATNDDEKGESTTTETEGAASFPEGPPLPMDLFPPLVEEDPDASDASASSTTINPNLVVSIDINGNRELEAVQECVQIVIREWKPRLIFVKSRELYAELGKQQQQLPGDEADPREEEEGEERGEGMEISTTEASSL